MRIKAIAVSVVLAASTLLALSQSASASALPTPAAHTASAAFPDCTAGLAPNSKAAPIVDCFATPQQALAYANHDRSYLTLSRRDALQVEGMDVSGRPSAVSPRSICASCSGYQLGVDYKDTHFGGSRLVWYSTTGDCQSGVVYQVAHMPSGWNDVVSSAADTNQLCSRWYHYHDASYVGKIIDCAGNCYDMYLSDGTSMSDQTSSERWYR